LLGFGGAMARGTREAVDEMGLFGALTGGLSATAGGIAAALCAGLLCAFLGKSRPKRL
ncbi:MAG: SpoVA/SpoVAEb family sporulation membrane protein, partial [Clostridia bacterium]|nr:SpoVA/SpoVAEb family sporulation membrane protein [Clostridia bacterium]